MAKALVEYEIRNGRNYIINRFSSFGPQEMHMTSRLNEGMCYEPPG